VDSSRDHDAFCGLHERLVGLNPRILEVDATITQLAGSRLTVLITGETGTGKDIAARLLHRRSPRYGMPFIKVNCPGIPESILESELFGYERGAFTGAHTAKPGRFELANGGTIFLDEITETAQSIQGKLLQVLDGEPFMRIGGTVPIRSDVRVVAATNVPLDEAVARDVLREDISFRLREVVVHLPPLRERLDDVPILVEHFNYNICNALKKPYQAIAPSLVAQMQKLPFPGNVRELGARVKKYVAAGSEADLLEWGDNLAIAKAGGEAKARSDGSDGTEERQFPSLKEAVRQAVEETERRLIEETLRHTLWNRRKAAQLLDTSYSSLLRRIEAYQIGKTP